MTGADWIVSACHDFRDVFEKFQEIALKSASGTD